VNPQPQRSRLAGIVLWLPYAWLIVFFLLPFLIVLKISLSQSAIAQPPYMPVFDLSAGWTGIRSFFAGLSLDNYISLGSDPLYVVSYMKSLQIAAFSTLMLLVIGYPIAYAITRTPPRLQAVLVVLVILPFWTSFLIRIYAWMNILQHDGPLNQLLLALHIVREPLAWLSTNTAVYIGIVYSYLPFMVLPLYAALEKLDQSLLEAAADLGCPRWRTFWAITLPLSAPGVIAGSLRKLSVFNIAALVLGIGFLYLPIVILVVYSFNASRLVAVWGGWSMRWYAVLAQDAALLQAASISFRVAFISAFIATFLGALAAVALVRFGRFRGRLPFAAMIYAPLVMPEVITGLSMLLLFVAVSIDRGFWTVVIAHTTMATCFVAIIVQSRLVDFDVSLEEAAMDLGASPAQTFALVTLPLIFPAIAASWMLAFALSLDDLVIASFTTGPGATTLPIRIYSEVRLGVSPEMNAVCSIVVAVVGLAVIAASILTKLSAGRGAPARVQP